MHFKRLDIGFHLFCLCLNGLILPTLRFMKIHFCFITLGEIFEKKNNMIE